LRLNQGAMGENASSKQTKATVLENSPKLPLPLDLFSEDKGDVPPDTESKNVRPSRATARFNQPDGLEEYAGDFRNFEKLDDTTITTIFSRRERIRTLSDTGPHPVDSPLKACSFVSAPDLDGNIEPDPVRLTSTGRTLIVGTSAAQMRACQSRLARTQACLMLLDGPPFPPEAEGVKPDDLLCGTGLRIRGCLGRFHAVAFIREKDTRLSRLLEGAPDYVDLVLDLRPAAATGRELPTPGYYVPDGDERELERILTELPQMIGVFEKPRYIYHAAGDCAHGRSGPPSCRGCLEICPVNALDVTDGSIAIDHMTCLGCGMCAMVCPTGAMRCLHTTPQDLLVAVQARLTEAVLVNQAAPTVMFNQLPADGTPVEEFRESIGAPTLSFPLEAIGTVGPEVWLCALAYGAGRVVVQLPDAYPMRLQDAFAGQLEWVAAVLAGVGLSPDRIRLIAAGSCTTPVDGHVKSAGPPADFSPFQSKRALIRCSVAHFAGAGASPVETVSLPPGAPFGGVRVDPTACTLCMACAGVCPTAALLTAGDTPALSLVESECIQCGQCRNICPEQAVSLHPRMVLDPARNEFPQLLYAQAPFACIRCGKSFASPGLVAKMIARLEGHWMFSREEDFRRLKMCRDCRVRNGFSSEKEERS
jgi:Fe-S-cluster-containing hydrogenase component 2